MGVGDKLRTASLVGLCGPGLPGALLAAAGTGDLTADSRVNLPTSTLLLMETGILMPPSRFSSNFRSDGAVLCGVVGMTGLVVALEIIPSLVPVTAVPTMQE